MIPLLVLVVISCAFISSFPSTQEMEIARAYDMPLWSSLSSIRQALRETEHSHRHAATTASLVDIPQFQKDQLNLPKLDDTKEKSLNDYFHLKPNHCEMTILLVRHCEKQNIREHCDYVGYERSVYLATQFGNDRSSRWPLPALLFAEGPGGRNNRHKMNFRELETVGPLAEKAVIDVDDSYTVSTVNDLARHILTLRPALCGKLVVVSWKHSEIGHLARRLGCGPLEGCPVDYRGKLFDEVWEIKHVYQRLPHSERKSLKKDKHASWHTYGSVQYEHFDPLAFSKLVGDYPEGGTTVAQQWSDEMVDIPERTAGNWKSAYWKATRGGEKGAVATQQAP